MLKLDSSTDGPFAVAMFDYHRGITVHWHQARALPEGNIGLVDNLMSETKNIADGS